MATASRHRQNARLLASVLVFLVTSSLLWPQPALTKKIGSGTDAVLDPITAALDAANIDVVASFARDFPIEKDERPRVARLGGFPVSLDRPPSAGNQDWMREFTRGAFDYIAAFRPADGIPSSSAVEGRLEAFLEAWERAPVEERVFIAFTREDAAHALKVAEVLRAEGMVVFTYLENSQSTPWARPEVVGRLFREAGQHFVIDSEGARRSSGVAFEALNYARLKAVTRRAEPSRTTRCRDIFGGLGNG